MVNCHLQSVTVFSHQSNNSFLPPLQTLHDLFYLVMVHYLSKSSILCFFHHLLSIFETAASVNVIVLHHKYSKSVDALDHSTKMTCAQPGHPLGLIWDFAIHMKKAWILSCQRLISLGGCPGWSVFIGRTYHFVGFVMLRLKYNW